MRKSIKYIFLLTFGLFCMSTTFVEAQVQAPSFQSLVSSGDKEFANQEYIKAECINPETVSVQEEQVVWDDIVADNIFVICNTPMAVGITKRTLFGFRQVEKKANIKAF